MNSQQQDHKTINTSCKECLFAIYEGKTQTGCGFNRIQKFDNVIEAYDEEKEFFVIPRLCNYYRNKSWNNGFIDHAKARKESALTFDIFFDFNTINEDFMNRATDLIEYNNWGNNHLVSEEAFYDLTKLEYRIFHNQIPKDQRKIISLFYMKHPNVSLTVNEFNDNIFIHDKLTKTRNTYHLIINANSEFDTDIITKINNLINDDMKKALVVKHKNLYVISNLAYKVQITSSEEHSILYNVNRDKILESIQNTDFYIEI